MNRRKLSKRSQHYKADMINLSRGIILHGKIKTTITRAKEIRGFLEPLVTKAKTNSLHIRRLLLSRLNNCSKVVNLLMQIATLNFNRPGGYLSIRRIGLRAQDAAVVAEIRFLDYPDQKEAVENI